MSETRPPLPEAVARFISGDESAGDAICAALSPPVRAAVLRILTEADAEGDDIVQDTLVAILGYLQRTKAAPQNIEAFAAAIARNRCVNLLHWRRRRRALDVDDLADQLPNPTATPLDLIDEQQTQELLVTVLKRLDATCRDLLDAIYRAERSIEQIRQELDLKTVQAVYYRKDACIRKAQKILNQELLGSLRAGGGEARMKSERQDD